MPEPVKLSKKCLFELKNRKKLDAVEDEETENRWAQWKKVLQAILNLVNKHALMSRI